MKFALVTSSTRGVGKAIGIKLLDMGYYVFFNYCNNDKTATNLENELSIRFNGLFKIIKSDLSLIEGVENLCNHITTVTQTLDCIVLNTGITCYDNFEDITLSNWNKVISTNVTMPFFIVQGLDKLLLDNSRVIFIGSRMGELAHGRSIPYAVSKASLHMLSKSLVKVYAKRNITVNTIAIGFVDTEWHNNKDENHINRIKGKIALNRLGDTEEIAILCEHLINNNYINGCTINIDGGYDMI